MSCITRFFGRDSSITLQSNRIYIASLHVVVIKIPSQRGFSNILKLQLISRSKKATLTGAQELAEDNVILERGADCLCETAATTRISTGTDELVEAF
jgi:hypothetical protein